MRICLSRQHTVLIMHGPDLADDVCNVALCYPWYNAYYKYLRSPHTPCWAGSHFTIRSLVCVRRVAFCSYEL